MEKRHIEHVLAKVQLAFVRICYNLAHASNQNEALTE
jgi:hypothetical protein